VIGLFLQFAPLISYHAQLGASNWVANQGLQCVLWWKGDVVATSIEEWDFQVSLAGEGKSGTRKMMILEVIHVGGMG
jgi:hypothetical protein